MWPSVVLGTRLYRGQDDRWIAPLIPLAKVAQKREMLQLYSVKRQTVVEVGWLATGHASTE